MLAILYRVLGFMIYPLVRIFVYSIKGAHNIPKKGGFIIASNHESLFDPFIIIAIFLSLTNKKIHFFAKRKGWWYFFGDSVCRGLAGCIPVDKSKSSRKSALKEASSILKSGGIIGIFPEGKISLDGKLSQAKTGVIRLSNRDIPVVPVGLIDTSKIWHPRKKFLIFSKCICISIGKPLIFNPKGASKTKLIGMANKLMIKIAALLGKKYMF